MRGAGRLITAAAAGYAAGHVPSADLAARALAAGTDIRTAGTGNPGALNVAHEVGTVAGLAVMAADIGKGYAAGRLGRAMAGPVGANVASCAAVIGHCHPVSHGFRGGKGVATSIGQVLATFPAYMPLDTAVAIATAAVPAWKQRTFAATAVASAVWVGSATLWWRRGWPNPGGPAMTAATPACAALSSVVIARRFLASGRAKSTAG